MAPPTKYPHVRIGDRAMVVLSLDDRLVQRATSLYIERVGRIYYVSGPPPSLRTLLSEVHDRIYAGSYDEGEDGSERSLNRAALRRFEKNLAACIKEIP
jgi:hypothetical protein